ARAPLSPRRTFGSGGPKPPTGVSGPALLAQNPLRSGWPSASLRIGRADGTSGAAFGAPAADFCWEAAGMGAAHKIVSTAIVAKLALTGISLLTPKRERL